MPSVRRTALALTALTALPVLLSAAPAAADGSWSQGKPVRGVQTTCVGPGGDLEFGGAVVRLTLRPDWTPADDFLIVVPVDKRTGLDAGDRITVDRGQRSADVVVPARGDALTPPVRISVRFGGDVVQRISVRGGCGVLDPDPAQAPGIDAVRAAGSTVSVTVTNRNDYRDDVLVALWPVGGSTAPQTYAPLEPGASGTVQFTGVEPGEYYVEAYGATEFVSSTSAPFPVTGESSSSGA